MTPAAFARRARDLGYVRVALGERTLFGRRCVRARLEPQCNGRVLVWVDGAWLEPDPADCEPCDPWPVDTRAPGRCVAVDEWR